MAPSPKFPFTSDDLAESRKQAAEQFAGSDPLVIEYCVASEVIINVFGPDWWAERLAGAKSDPYFVKDADDPVTPYIHQARVIELGNDLFNCQSFRGFAQLRPQMRSRSLGGVYHELHVARILHDSGHDVAFVVPSGVKGDDFDLLVDGVLAVEVETKQDATPYTRSSLRSTLSHARTQLPQAGPGLIALRIPDAWGSNQAFNEEADELLDEAFGRSERVNAILVLWDEWLQGSPKGAARLTRFRLKEKTFPRAEFSDLPRLVQSLAFDGSLENSEIRFHPGDWTFACAVRRFGGPGPLFETFDGQLQMVFNRGGSIANRVAGEIRISPTPIAAINGRWANVMFRFGPSGADLRIDDELVDSWQAGEQAYQGLRLMPAVDADLREQLIYDEWVEDRQADQLFEYLSSKSQGSYVQFRRGDVARFRVGGEGGPAREHPQGK